MYRYGTKSEERLATCDERIIFVFREVIKYVDCSILEGARSDARQIELYNTVLPDGSRVTHLDGVTKRSKHQTNNEQPMSAAVDACAYPIDWKDRTRFCLFSGFVLGIARSNGIKMISGIDWDFDFTATDHNFFDGPHYELVD